MNPCEKCTRVPSPDACDDKQCRDWQAWWIPLWEQTCLTILRGLSKQAANAESEKEKVQT